MSVRATGGRALIVTVSRQLRGRSPNPLPSTVDNLIENAIQHTVGDPRIGIAVGPSRAEDDAVEVAVTDEGPGIPPNEIRVLDGPTESSLHHGSGLGLWVAKWVTESYGGEIRFDENGDTGSVVTLSLPAASRVDRLIGVS